tara:strand:+ start:661 stop:1617 length:957 start_codon:yes stop_codon:yes gene_type:complete
MEYSLKKEKKSLETQIVLNTPVLFLIFNRPDTTQRVFNAIKEAKPTRLYIGADGPREKFPNETKFCQSARNIATNVSWKCEVKTLFRNQNLGCRKAVSQAIKWFFEHEPEGIILEDDCLPSQSFFIFCQQLLEQFRNNNKIGAICGFYSNELDYKPNYSYFFSRYLRVWGWAGWRRTIEGYDVDLKNFEKRNETWAKNIFKREDFFVKKYFEEIFDLVAKNIIDTWDAQLQYLLWEKNQNVIVASKNQICNIGWDKATHAVKKDHNHGLKISKISFPMKKLNFKERDQIADNFIEKKSYKITAFEFLKKLIKKINEKN